MSVLFVALPIALLLGASALAACLYCVRDGQYDDLDSPAIRILVEESATEPDDARDNDSKVSDDATNPSSTRSR